MGLLAEQIKSVALDMGYENSKDFQDSLRFEKYMQDIGLKAETERKFGVVGMRWAALQEGIGIIYGKNIKFIVYNRNIESNN